MASKFFCFFKLFNSIKDQTEAADFARLEIESLIGKPEAVHNVFDVMRDSPLGLFSTRSIRIQDILTHELPYGDIQGYSLWSDRLDKIDCLIRRLGYTRELLVVVDGAAPQKLLRQFFPSYQLGKNTQIFQVDGHVLFRFITHYYFLEKSQYISKLSRNEQEVDSNVAILFSHLADHLYRVPASESMSVGKRLQDYFASREESSLYLTHYMHPYKGKFHPKMARAIINYIYPLRKGLILDNFAGSGTSLVETMLLGLDSKGVEINPLSVLMTKVKCRCLTLETSLLKEEVERYLEMVHDGVRLSHAASAKTQLSLLPKFERARASQRMKSDIPERVLNGLRNKGAIEQILSAQALLPEFKNEDIRDFLLLGLSGTISDLYRRTVAKDFENVLRGRLRDLYLRVYLFQRLNEKLKIKLGSGTAYVGDTRNMGMIGYEEVNGIVNSPPYSTALDYIKNDEPQLYILGLVPSMSDLESNMMGHPRVNYDKLHTRNEMTSDKAELKRFSPYGVEVLSRLVDGRANAALRTYKFWSDMIATTREMYRVLKPGAKCAVVIGNNHYSLDGNSIEVQNDRAFWEMARVIGFQIDLVIKRNLEKSLSGNIRYESIIILQK